MNAWSNTYSARMARDKAHMLRMVILLVALLEMAGLLWLGVRHDFAAAGVGFAAIVKEHVRRRVMGE